MDVHIVGRIDRNIYKCITEDIVTDEVVITSDDSDYKNSIITFMKIDAKDF